MKKIIIFAAMATLITSVCNAQLKVKSNGTVETGRVLINAKDSVFWNGDYGMFCDLYGDTQANATAICGRVDANVTPVSGATNVIGIRGEATGCTYTYGVKGSAIGGAAYGVYGLLPPVNYGVNYGAAIYGTTNTSPIVLDSSWAGYFDGMVKITNGLWVTGYGIHGTLYSRSAPDNSFSTANQVFGETNENDVSDKLSTLQLGTFHETLIDNNVTRNETEYSSVEKHSAPEADTRLHYGLSAEQLEETFPDLVTEDKDGNKYINYVEMVPILVQAINELSAKVEALEAERGNSKAIKAKSAQVDIADNVNLSIPNKAQRIQLNIYDLSGKLVRTTDVKESGDIRLSTYTKGLATGTYAYSLIVDGKKQKARKILIKHI